jgi:hypothetical protein
VAQGLTLQRIAVVAAAAAVKAAAVAAAVKLRKQFI